MSLYERLGQSETIIAVVHKFYDIMLQDPRVSHYFANTDMDKQKSRQIAFITLVTGGPNLYQGTDMKTAHCKHSIGHLEFDASWENL
jgi:hemoglobin